jgi:BlaI family penicillinase repressor
VTQRKQPKPTNAELAILQVLWDRGPSTVREVQEELSESRATGYTTALKLLQIMTEKGLVVRDESQRSHVYRARFSRQQVQRRMVGDLLDRAFDGSAYMLVLQALSTKPASAEEIARIRELLEELEGGGDDEPGGTALGEAR